MNPCLSVFAFLHAHALCASPVCLDQTGSSTLSLLFLNVLRHYCYFPVSWAIFYIITSLSNVIIRNIIIFLLEYRLHSLGEDYLQAFSNIAQRMT